MKTKRSIVSLVLIVVLAIVLGTILTQQYQGYILDAQDYVKSYGGWAPLVIFIMIVVASSIGLIFQIPVAVAGLLLDIKLAFLLSVIGLTIGAVISFSVARWLGRDYMKKKFIDKIKGLREYDNHLHKRGFLTVLLLRLTIIPYELINIAGGFSRIRFSHFIFATLLGIIPGVTIAIWFAKSTANIYSLQFLLSAVINISFSLLPLISKRVRRIIYNGE